MAAQLLAGLVRVFLPQRARRRLAPRRLAPARVALVRAGRRVPAVRLDDAPGGMGLLAAGRPPAPGTILPLLLPGGVRWARIAHARRVAPAVWRLGLAYHDAPLAGAGAGTYLAA
jgi:hypothetical protein